MTDTWRVLAISEEDDVLGEFSATPVNPGLIYQEVVAQLLQCDGSIYTHSGIINRFEVRKNSRIYAVCYCDGVYSVYAGQSEAGQLMVKVSELAGGVEPVRICTCGGWSVYGKEADIHSDSVANTCDLRKP